MSSLFRSVTKDGKGVIDEKETGSGSDIFYERVLRVVHPRYFFSKGI